MCLIKKHLVFLLYEQNRCEAALACARLGLETIIFTVSVDSIAMMPCNPNIGGSSKGHLVSCLLYTSLSL